jgi:small subunit ribosomal protein S6
MSGGASPAPATAAGESRRRFEAGMATDWRKFHQREYEQIFILDPTVAAEQSERVVQRIRDVMDRLEGRLIRVEYWGKRKLAFKVRKQGWGFFYLLRFVGGGGLVAELERNYRMLDAVMRFQSIVVKRDVKPDDYTIGEGELEFRLDVLAKEASEPLAEEREPEAPVEAPGADVAAEAPGADVAAEAPGADVGVEGIPAVAAGVEPDGDVEPEAAAGSGEGEAGGAEPGDEGGAK